MNDRQTDLAPLKCLQINLQHNSAAAADLSQLILDLNLDVILVQEPFCNCSNGKISNVPRGYKTFHFPSAAFQYGTAIIVKSNIVGKPILDICCNEVVALEMVSNGTRVQILSVYCRPMLPNLFEVMNPLFACSSLQAGNAILCMDSNAHDPLWNSIYTDQKGKELLDIIVNNQLSIVNTIRADLSMIPQHTSFVDVTHAGNHIRDKISNWHFLDIPSLSDHPFIRFDLSTQLRKASRVQKRLPKLDYIDGKRFERLLLTHLPPRLPLCSSRDVDVAIDGLTSAIQKAATNKVVQLPCPSCKRVLVDHGTF